MTSQSSSSNTSSSSAGSDSDGRGTRERRSTRKVKHSSKSKAAEPVTSSSDSSDDSHSGENSVTLLESILNDSAPTTQESANAQSSAKTPSKESEYYISVRSPKEKPRPQSATNKSAQAPVEIVERHPQRPKSAKYKTRRLQRGGEKHRPFISSSSASSLSTFDDDSTSRSERDFDQLNKQEQIEYRARLLRELLLHRYLDFRHNQSLNHYGKYFERHNKKSRSLQGPPRQGSRRKHLETRALYASGKRAPKPRREAAEEYEESIRRAARRLAGDLIRTYQERQLEEEEKMEVKKAPRPKSGRDGKRGNDEEKISDGSDKSTKSLEESKQEGSKHVTVVAPCEEDLIPTEKSPRRKKEQKSPISERKSILKQDKTTPKKPPRPYTAVMVSSQKRKGRRTPYIAPSVYDKRHEPLYDEQFTYSYLTALLHTLRCDDIPITSYPDETREKPSRPKTVPTRPSTSHPGRRMRRVAGSGEEEKKGDEKKKDEEPGEEEHPQNGSETKEQKKERVKSAPQVRPGSHPIKCSWKQSKDNGPKKPEPKYSDHQLKSTDNPVVADWLKRKNALARRQKFYATRQNREKREKLMDEYNQREDKRELALVEYERWKKKKNRDILLRRRREIAVTNVQTEKSSSDLKPGTGMASLEDQRDATAKTNVTSFSDLRSSAAAEVAMPTPAAKTLRTPGKPRPKSAPTNVSFSTPEATYARRPSPSNGANLVPVKFDLTNGGVEVLGHVDAGSSNLSAREPLIGNKKSPTERKSENFLEQFMEVMSPKSMFDVPPPGTFNSQESDPMEKKESSKTAKRDQYNDWVRQKTKGKERSSSSKKSFPSGRRSPDKSRDLPQHDPLDNELISDLAKRRIKKILDSKKEVDTGLGEKRPRTASAVPVQSKSTNSEEFKKWRLRDDLTKDQVSSSAPVPKTRKSRRRDAERPVFSYDRKTESKSVFFERNPVVRRALNQT